MAESSISVLDSGDNAVDVKTRQPGGTGPHIQIFEHAKTTPYVNIDLDENGVVVLGAAALLHNWEVFNRSAAALYVKIYNKATTPTNGDTPLKVWEILPGNAPFQGEVVSGHDFSLGLGLRCTTGIAHADVGAPAANDCLINLGYRAG